MRKSYYAIPLLAAGSVFTAMISAGVTSAAPGVLVPIPTEYPWCELDMFCYDSDIGIALNPRSSRHDVGYGGGAAFGSGDDGN